MMTTMSSNTGKESSDCDAEGAGGCLGTVSSSIHPLRCTKDTLGVHVVVNQTIGGIFKNVRLDCVNCDSVKGIEQLGILTHSSNRVIGINQTAEVVSKVGGEKEANSRLRGRLGSPPKR